MFIEICFACTTRMQPQERGFDISKRKLSRRYFCGRSMFQLTCGRSMIQLTCFLVSSSIRRRFPLKRKVIPKLKKHIALRTYLKSPWYRPRVSNQLESPWGNRQHDWKLTKITENAKTLPVFLCSWRAWSIRRAS